MPTVFTIGHSNQPADEFVALLVNRDIEYLLDVRSRPNSRFHRFKREPLSWRLSTLGIYYLYVGDQLGGYPESADYYVDGRVAYERVAALRGFRLGIDRVVDLCEQHSLVLMCSQENPVDCHRHPLLASALIERGIEVLHLRRDGSVQDAAALTVQASQQMPLFELVGEDLTWRSPKRIR